LPAIVLDHRGEFRAAGDGHTDAVDRDAADVVDAVPPGPLWVSDPQTANVYACDQTVGTCYSFAFGSHGLTANLNSAEAIVERPLVPGYQSPWDQYSVLANYIQHFFTQLSAGPYTFTNPDYSIQMYQNGSLVSSCTPGNPVYCYTPLFGY
jgi:hypothetical protein